MDTPDAIPAPASPRPGRHIAVAGNIGSGKTTLATLLAKSMRLEPYFEDADVNPYISDFYADMPRWAFNLQVYLLDKRLARVLEIRSQPRDVVQDRTIYEDAHIFAANLHGMGLMSTRDYETYFSLFRMTTSLVAPPDLIIYLRASVPKLVCQIQKRGRAYESAIRLDYLAGLNDRYEEWVAGYKAGRLLVVDVDERDFENNPRDLSFVIDQVSGVLDGLFAAGR